MNLALYFWSLVVIWRGNVRARIHKTAAIHAFYTIKIYINEEWNAWAQEHQINPTYFSALVYASECPDKGYRIPFFLLAFGIIGVFTAIMTFFSNTLWTHSKSCRCEGSKETVRFVQGINIGLTCILFVFVFVGEY